MGLRIRTNVPALSAQRELEKNRNTLEKVARQLASGKRITQSADDAAGLSIATAMTARIRSISQANRNAQDGISMLQVAEGSMQEISNILIRFRESGIQASSDTIGDPERQMITREVMQLGQEVDRIAKTTEYNGKKLLTGGGVWPVLPSDRNDQGQNECP